MGLTLQACQVNYCIWLSFYNGVHEAVIVNCKMEVHACNVSGLRPVLAALLGQVDPPLPWINLIFAISSGVISISHRLVNNTTSNTVTESPSSINLCIGRRT